MEYNVEDLLVLADQFDEILKEADKKDAPKGFKKKPFWLFKKKPAKKDSKEDSKSDSKDKSEKPGNPFAKKKASINDDLISKLESKGY